jgi:hypothetical protein
VSYSNQRAHPFGTLVGFGHWQPDEPCIGIYSPGYHPNGLHVFSSSFSLSEPVLPLGLSLDLDLLFPSLTCPHYSAQQSVKDGHIDFEVIVPMSSPPQASAPILKMLCTMSPI